MGAKSWMLVYADAETVVGEALRSNPQFDPDTTLQFVQRLFPKHRFERIEDGDLLYICPDEDEICAGCFPGLSIVAATEFSLDYPSQLPSHFLEAGGDAAVYLHAMHSVVDWFAYAKWVNGELVRSLSLSADNGILEDVGRRLPFEEPFWEGRKADDAEEEPFPFHPLELGEEALKELFGFQIEGGPEATIVNPEVVALARFRRSRSRWKLW